MSVQMGSQSLQFSEAPFIVSHAAVAGMKEGEGPLGKCMDYIDRDDRMGQDTWEEAESAFQKKACEIAVTKANIDTEEVRFLFGGDLLRQGIASSHGIQGFQIPFFGLFGACSTSAEALALAAMTVAGDYAEYAMAVTSSHFGSAEKEFRFPLSYANQRPLSAQWTVTGSGAFVVGKKKSHVKISGITIGKIVNYGLKDSQNMGACMAPAACDTILTNLSDFNRSVEEYDRIITGDLGYVGQSILFDLIRQRKPDMNFMERHLDCGMKIFNQKTQDTHAGGSGCGCAAITLASYILPNLENGTWKRVLFIPTGALMSTVSYNEGKSVPGIAHAIVLEHC